MTSDILVGTASIVLSLIFSYIPGLNTWFAALQKEFKQLIMLVLIVIVAVVTYGLACAGVLSDLAGIQLACDQAGLLGLLRAVVVAIIANQAAYQVSPNTSSVREAKS